VPEIATVGLVGGLRGNGAIGSRKNLPWTGLLSSGNAWADVAAPGDGARPGGAGKMRLAGWPAKPNTGETKYCILLYFD